MPPTETPLENNLEVVKTPPTTDTEDNSLNEVIKGALSEADKRARDAEKRARDAEDELTKLRAAPAPVNNQTEVTDDNFWAAPAKNLETLFNRQVAPLRKDIEETKQRDLYEGLKKQYRGYEGFINIEGLIDDEMKGKIPTHENIQRAIRYVVGDLALQGKVTSTVSNPPNNTPIAPTPATPATPNNNQAHLRPSRQVVPADNNNKPARRELNEFEKRIARENKQTPDEYLDMLEAGVTVNTWKKGK